MENKIKYCIFKVILKQLVSDGIIDELEAAKITQNIAYKFEENKASKPSQSLDNITL